MFFINFFTQTRIGTFVPLAAAERADLACACQCSDFLNEFLPLGLGSVVVVLAGALRGLRRALGSRPRRQEGDLVDDVLHLVDQRIGLLVAGRLGLSVVLDARRDGVLVAAGTGVRAVQLLSDLLIAGLLARLVARPMLKSLRVSAPLGDRAVGPRRAARVAQRAAVAHLHEAQGAATLLVAQVAGTLVGEQRRLLGVGSSAPTTDQAQLGLDLATGRARRRGTLVADEGIRQPHRLDTRVIRILTQERLHQGARNLNVTAAVLQLDRHQTRAAAHPTEIHVTAQAWSRY